MVTKTFNVQSLCGAILVHLVYLVPWCCLRRKEFLQTGSLEAFKPEKGVSGLGGDMDEPPWQVLGVGRWGSPCMVCLAGGNLRLSRVGEYFSWPACHWEI